MNVEINEKVESSINLDEVRYYLIFIHVFN
jgi:hypothetical protein